MQIMDILVVDDSRIVRSGIISLLRPGLAVNKIGEAGSSAEAIEMLRADSWDVVILDISMPGGNGYEVLEWLTAESISVLVLMQSNYLTAATIQRCLDLGAAGFVAKQALPDELVPGIRAILRGERFLCRVATATMA
jgi:two-component system, NarL family, invasion response regulator UvrY